MPNHRKPHIFIDGIECKECTKCRTPKPLDLFPKRKVAADGLGSDCKACCCARTRAYQKAHPEETKARERAWRKAHPESKRRALKKWYESHKHEYLPKVRANWHARGKFAQHAYRAANVEHHRHVSRLWREKNRDQSIAKLRLYKQSHRDKFVVYEQRRRAVKAGTEVLMTEAQWRECLAFFGNTCAYCGCAQERLQQEHVVAVSKGGSYSPDNIVPACRKCNSSKHASTMEEWFHSQPFFSDVRLHLILVWQEQHRLAAD